MGKSFNYNKRNNGFSDGGWFKKDTTRNKERVIEKNFVRTFQSSSEIKDIDDDDLVAMLSDEE